MRKSTKQETLKKLVKGELLQELAVESKKKMPRRKKVHLLNQPLKLLKVNRLLKELERLKNRNLRAEERMEAKGEVEEDTKVRGTRETDQEKIMVENLLKQ